MAEASATDNCLAAQRFQQLYNCFIEQLGCDIQFDTKENIPIRLHKVVLLMNSVFFRRLAYINSRQLSDLYLFPETRWTVLYAVVKFLYGDSLYLQADTVQDIHILGKTFEIPEIVELCQAFESQNTH